MNVLAMDTSTKNFSIAVARDEKVLRYRNVVLQRVLSNRIVPAIDRILKQAKMPLQQLDGLAVGLGPGSFTSLRVGLATIKGLHMATGKPVVGFCSLDILAQNVRDSEIEQICTICDARRGLFYACLYQNKKGRLKRKTNYLLTALEPLLDRIKEDTLFVGDGVSLCRDALTAAGRKGTKKYTAYFADQKEWSPQARELVALALERLRKNEVDDINRLVPLYLYPDDCQIRKN